MPGASVLVYFCMPCVCVRTCVPVRVFVEIGCSCEDKWFLLCRLRQQAFSIAATPAPTAPQPGVQTLTPQLRSVWASPAGSYTGSYERNPGAAPVCGDGGGNSMVVGGAFGTRALQPSTRTHAQT